MVAKTIGIDLSAQPKGTAACVIEWTSPARVTHLSVGADNRTLVDLIEARRPTKVAIDAPFGWPAPFVSALVDFTRSGAWPTARERRPLLLRTTDIAVKAETGTDPLSVSSDRIAICAMRCAELLVEIGRDGGLDRTGAGLVIEVYPAAALRQWGFDPRGYKGPKPEKVEKRHQLVHDLATTTSEWLDVSDEQRVFLGAATTRSTRSSQRSSVALSSSVERCRFLTSTVLLRRARAGSICRCASRFRNFGPCRTCASPRALPRWSSSKVSAHREAIE